MFQCDMCGLCSQNLHLNNLYKDLDRGDGICKFYDCSSHKCTIYNKRPLKCNVDEMYNKIFKGSITLEDYYAANKKI